MSQNIDTDMRDGRPKGHPTTRRGFVIALSFSVVSLYGLWAAYGAAPTSLKFLSKGGGGGHGGMPGMGGGGGAKGPTPEEFRHLTEKFIEANKLPDGSVRPTRNGMAKMAKAAGPDDEDKHQAPAKHGTPGMAVDEHEAERREVAAKRGMPGMAADGHENENQPIEVYMVASRYGYEPSVLRLEANVPYRFRIMAVDAIHGASINFGGGGRIIRCPAGVLVEAGMTFTRPGNLFVYCTSYCGEGHDLMKGTIIVA